MSESNPPKRTVTALWLRELQSPVDPVAVLDALRGRACPWLLDSALALAASESADPEPAGPHARMLGRYSFVGADPYWIARSFGGRMQIECLREARPLPPEASTCDPFDRVRELMPSPPSVFGGDPGSPLPFAGGVVGYWGYELAEQIEAIRFRAQDDLGLPDLALLFVDRLVAVDHWLGRAFAVGLGFGADSAEALRLASQACETMRFAETLEVEPEPTASGPCSSRALPSLRMDLPEHVEAQFDEESYVEAVCRVGEQIRQGNVYQANLTHRMQVDLGGVSPWKVYRVLRSFSPAPFAAYIELPELAILSSSPERFLRADAEGHVESRPIKGTRPRSEDAGEDARLRAELIASEKDRAENLMIVDLVRNDLGRVCEIGSVWVPELHALEAYATVFQLVSTVAGQLRSDCDVLHLLRASFPPGSMTGAPKIAAMKILDTLEPVRRGVYSGVLGYLDVRGGLDLSVVIRTLVVTGGRAYLNVGGGIVADSDPHAEYRETLDKARAPLAALASAIGHSMAPGVASGDVPETALGAVPRAEAPVQSGVESAESTGGEVDRSRQIVW